MKSINYTATAARQRGKLASDVRARIDAKLFAFARHGGGDVKRLAGHPGARLRIGDWRVVFVERDDEILVVAVGHRREIYDRS